MCEISLQVVHEISLHVVREISLDLVCEISLHLVCEICLHLCEISTLSFNIQFKVNVREYINIFVGSLETSEC